MSVSRHPVALRLEQQVGEGTRLLATVMALPLLDGIFAALVLAGAVSSLLGMLEVGLLIFGGSATLAVVLAEMDGTRRDQIRSVLLVGALVVPLAALQAAIAPTIETLIDLGIFERFAALVILAIAAKTASATIGEYLPRPSVIIGLGLVASIRPNGVELAFIADPTAIIYGTGAAMVGVSFALGVALFGPWLRGNVDVDRFRFGSAVALGVLPLSLLGIGPIETGTPIALAVLLLTGLLAFDPSSADEYGIADSAAAEAGEPASGFGGSARSISDGGDVASTDEESATDPDSTGDVPASGSDGDTDGSSPDDTVEDRVPWL